MTSLTKRVFWDEPYRTTLSTKVARVEGADIWLEASIFFAESGGQESDTGRIGGHVVERARLENSELIYTLAADHGLTKGCEVDIAIDWPRRYALMRLHFAAEIVLEIAAHEFGLTQKIGAHIGPERARIDFAHDTPITPMLDALSEKANAWIEQDAAITTGFDDQERLRRFWFVEGLAHVPCGGTHLRRTGEVGRIVLKRRNVGRAKERIEITLLE